MNKDYSGFYIDSNVFVQYAKKDHNLHNRSKKFIDLIINKYSKCKELKFFASRFSGVEIASALRRKNSRKDAEAFLFKKENMWKNVFLPLPPSPKEKFQIDNFISELMEIALKFGTDSSDTIQTHAIDTYKEELDFVVTNDKDFVDRLGKKYRRIKVFYLKDDFTELCNLLKSLAK